MRSRLPIDNNHSAVLEAATAIRLNARLNRIRRFQVHRLSSIREGCMNEEREKLDRVFNRSRSRLAYVNVGLAVLLVLAGIVEICIMLLGY